MGNRETGALSAQFARYTVSGALSFSIALAIPYVLHEQLNVGESTAVAIGLAVVFVINFVVVRTWVFKASGPLGNELLKFALSSALFRVAEYALFSLLASALNWHYLLALAVAMVVSFVCKFFFQRRVVFGGGDPT